MILAKSLKIVKNSALHQVVEHQKISLILITFYFFHGHSILGTRGSSGHLEKITTVNNGNFTKKCGISKIICDTACRVIYLNTRKRLILKG